MRVNIAWTLVSNFVYSASQWLILIAIARLGTTETLGQYAYALAITTPILLFSNVALRFVQATDVHHDIPFPTYFTVRLITVSMALAFITAIAFGFRENMSLMVVLLCVGCVKANESVCDIIHGFLQQHEDFPLIARLRMATGVIGLLSMTVSLIVTQDIAIATFILASVSLLRLVLLDVLAVRLRYGQRFCLATNWNRKQISYLLKTCAPLGLVALMTSLTACTPQYLLKHYHGASQLGIYAALLSFTLIGNQVVEAVARSSATRLAGHYSAGQILSYRSLLAKLCGIGAALGLIALTASALLGYTILSAVFGEEYALYHHSLTLLAIAAGINYFVAFLGVGLTAARQFSIQPAIGGTTFLAQLVLSALLIPRWGLTGTAMSVIGASAINLLTCAYAVYYCSFRTFSASPTLAFETAR